MADVSMLSNFNIGGISNIGAAIPTSLFGLSWTAVFNIFGGLIIGIVLIYFFAKRGKVKYHIQLYERDSSGIPIPVDTDILEERTINKGKNTIYMLKKYQALAHPPMSKFIYKRNKSLFGQELWCDYLRERQDFIPIKRLVESGLTKIDDMAEFTKRLIDVYNSTPADAKQKFVYSPMIPTAMAKLKFEPMDYNMAEMQQIRLAQREVLYADKQGWMQTYGPMIGIGLAAVCIIVTAFLAFQFASKNIGDVTSAANTVAQKLGDIATGCLSKGPAPKA